MPQLDASTFPSQIFWLVLSFVALYVVLSRALLPRIHSVLALRDWTIDSDVEEAGRMKDQAEGFKANYEQALASSRAQSQALLAKTQKDIASAAAARQAELDNETEAKMAESTRQVQAAKDKVKDKLTPIAADVASMIVELLVHQKPQSGDVNAAVTAISRERGL